MCTSQKCKPNSNLFGLQEAPVFEPTIEEFADPLKYIRSIKEIGEKAGLCKIIPPKGWKPPFSIDQKNFRFLTRKQKLNELEANSRTQLNFLELLDKFWEGQGKPLQRIPSMEKKPIDLLMLKKQVSLRGGPKRVSEKRQWSEVSRALGFSKNNSSAPHTLRQTYLKYIEPFENYVSQSKSQNGGRYSNGENATKKQKITQKPKMGEQV